MATETAMFQQAAAAELGLGVSDMKALSLLSQTGPVTAGEIASGLGLTTGAVTSLINRLERKSFVRRISDPDDGRKVVIEAVPEGLRTSNAVYASMGEGFARMLGGFSEAELETITRYHEESIELTKHEIVKLGR